MRFGQVVVGLHFGQAACGALEFEAEPLAGVQVLDGGGGGDQQFHVAVVELVHHGDEPPGGV